MSTVSGQAARLAALFGLDGKVAVVTGASYGIGKAAAVLLAEAGARVVLAHDVGDAHIDDATAAIHHAGGQAVARPVDMRDEASIGTLFREAVDVYLGIDILVNAHTLVAQCSLTEMSSALWDDVQSVNLRGAFLTIREAARLMTRQGTGGSIVNVATIGAVHPVLNGNAAYSAAKAGLAMLTRNVALDYAEYRIRANAVLPGAVPLDASTPRAGVGSKSGPGSNAARHLSGYGSPDSIASVVLFLAGGASAYVTGQCVAADGGFLVS